MLPVKNRPLHPSWPLKDISGIAESENWAKPDCVTVTDPPLTPKEMVSPCTAGIAGKSGIPGVAPQPMRATAQTAAAAPAVVRRIDRIEPPFHAPAAGEIDDSGRCRPGSLE